jgi:hypothetical protein
VRTLSLAPLALLAACASTVNVGDRGDSAPPDTDTVDTDTVDTDPVDTDTVDTDTVDTDSGGTGDTDTGKTGDTATPGGFAHLPVFIIDSKAAIGDTEKSPGFLRVVEDHDGTLTDLDAAPTAFLTAIGIEVHGSSSTSYPKLGYKFECVDAANEDQDCALVGLPEGSDWVLHAPYSDKTFMRNALAYSLGRDAAEASGRWEPRSQFVELILDGDYRGVYLLVERVARESDRLDIPRTTLDDGTVAGGFIVKADGHRSAGFDTAIGTQIDWVSPKAGAVTAAEAAYIANWFDTVEAAFTADTFADPEIGYAAWIDVDGWVDHWLLNELTHNIDAYRLSAYLWADGPPGTTPLHAGPLWDFDRAWGNCNYCDAWNTYGYIYDDLDRCGYAYQYPMWWERLREDPVYEARLRTRWDELRADLLSDTALHDRITEMKEELAEAAVRDDARWGTIGTYVDPNYYVGGSWDEEIDWLEEWALDRAAWLDAYLPR